MVWTIHKLVSDAAIVVRYYSEPCSIAVAVERGVVGLVSDVAAVKAIVEGIWVAGGALFQG